LRKPTLVVLIISSLISIGFVVFGLLVMLNQIESIEIYLSVYILGFGPSIIIWAPLISWGTLKIRDRRAQGLPIMRKPTRIVLIVSIILFLISGTFSGLVWILIGDNFAAGIASINLMIAAVGVIILPPLISYFIMRKKSVSDVV